MSIRTKVWHSSTSWRMRAMSTNLLKEQAQTEFKFISFASILVQKKTLSFLRN